MLARDLKYYPEDQVEMNEKRKRRVKKSRALQKKNNSLVKLIYLFVPIMIAGVCMFVLFRYVNITQVREDITNLEYEKSELEKNKINLMGDLEGLKSSPKIVEQAKNKLGMDYPENDQVVYLKVSDSPSTESNQKSNPLDLLLGKIGDLF